MPAPPRPQEGEGSADVGPLLQAGWSAFAFHAHEGELPLGLEVLLHGL